MALPQGHNLICILSEKSCRIFGQSAALAALQACCREKLHDLWWQIMAEAMPETCCCQEAVRVDVEILCASISLTRHRTKQPAFHTECRRLKRLRGFVLAQAAPWH
jgi:hypothetical protein